MAVTSSLADQFDAGLKRRADSADRTEVWAVHEILSTS